MAPGVCAPSRRPGGIVFAQQPDSARFPSMPRSAIETGCVDFVLRPEQIAQALVKLGRHPYVHANATLGPLGAAPEERSLLTMRSC